MFSVYAADGGARHAIYLSPQQQANAIEFFWVGNIFIVIPLTTGKISVAFLLLRLLPPAKPLRYILYYIMISITLIIIGVIVVILAQCQPVEALWNPPAGHCWPAKPIQGWELFAGSMSLSPESYVFNLPCF